MLFNSYEFVLFYLPIVSFVFFFLGKKNHDAATLWIVISSVLFYGWWDYSYVPLLIVSICFNYIIGLLIEKTCWQKKFLICGTVGNLILLGYFKYTGFFIDNINLIYGSKILEIGHIILPLGISFFTFTQTAYLVDVYRGETKNTNFMTYCEFVTIFPHLIAGPIINHKEMIPQFLNPENFKVNWNNIAKGFTLFTIGLFKKVVIADTLSPWVGEVFKRPNSITFIEGWIGSLGYTMQLYFDFSAYSEMAIGLGLMFNMKFPVNFNSPYKAHSIIDFWRRWHMTLGYWVKHYLYIPMGGNRHGEWRKMRNLIGSMLLIGFWHGAGWTFVLWGGMHGIALAINHQWRRLNINLPSTLCWSMTFFFVLIAWVFFRAENIHDGVAVLKAMTDIYTYNHSVHGILKGNLDIIVITLTIVTALTLYAPNSLEIMERHKCNMKWIIVTVVMLVSALLGMTQNSEFLYFQF